MRKKLLLGMLWIGGSHLFALQLELAPRVFAHYENGPVTTAATIGLGLEFGLLQPMGPGNLYTRIGLFSGAFIGESYGLNADIGYYFRFSEIWQPGIGVSYHLDGGSRLIAGFSYDGIPERPMSYLGLKLELLRFVTPDYSLSLLGTSLSLALCEGPPIVRAEMDLFRLGYQWNPMPGQAPPSHPTTAATKAADPPSPVWLGISYGFDYTLLGFGLYALRPLSLETTISFRDLELSIDYILLGNRLEQWNQAWLFSISLLFAPSIGYWNPAIGIGFLYANPDYTINGVTMSQLVKGDFTSIHLTLKPLRFQIPLSPSVHLMLSVAELRYGSITPTQIQVTGSSGSLAFAFDLARIGVGLKL